MIRHCDGTDENLVMYVDKTRGDVVIGDVDRSKHEAKPCTCGRVFSDVRYSTIFPHEAI